MRKNLLAVFTVFAVVIGSLTPTQSFSAPIASPGKTAGNGPCVTSGSTNSQTQSTKNTNKTCTYSIGDPGPGGGIIFYYDSVGFNCGVGFTSTGSPIGDLCHYLEVAPSGWNTGADPVKIWAVSANQRTDVSGITNDSSAYNNALGIGLGYKNSDLIVAQGNDTTTAAGAARAYTNNAKTDWYLPTTAELNLLCQWNRGVTQDVTIGCTGGTINTGTGATSAGFVGNLYWSSSEYGGDDADVAWGQDFSGGNQSTYAKPNTFYVRPVRAF
jgi:hypothetical protein